MMGPIDEIGLIMAATVITPNLIQCRYALFVGSRSSATERYSSYDLCYGYFCQNKGKLIGPRLEESCLQLWSFLSSWGMVARGNALQGKSYAYLKDVVEFINRNPQYYQSTIDSATYPAEMLTLYHGLKAKINIPQKSQKTVITKIMLGVYGCIPAFDQYVCDTFGTSTMGDLSIRNISSVVSTYVSHKSQIDSLANNTPLLSFNRSYIVGLSYTPAKIIDMVAFARP